MYLPWKDDYKRDTLVTIRLGKSVNTYLNHMKQVYNLGTTDTIVKAIHNQFLEAKDIILNQKPKENAKENNEVKSIPISIRLDECELDEVNYIMDAYNLSRTGAIRYSIEMEAYRIMTRNREEAIKNG